LSLYFDASALLPIFVAEPASARVDRFLDQTSEALLVSEFASAEVASALSRSVRTGRLGGADAKERLFEFDAWKAALAEAIEVEGADVRGAGLIVRRFDLMLRTPDALHVAICRRLGAQLVTLDIRLAEAASKLGVTLATI